MVGRRSRRAVTLDEITTIVDLLLADLYKRLDVVSIRETVVSQNITIIPKLLNKRRRLFRADEMPHKRRTIPTTPSFVKLE